MYFLSHYGQQLFRQQVQFLKRKNLYVCTDNNTTMPRDTAPR